MMVNDLLFALSALAEFMDKCELHTISLQICGRLQIEQKLLPFEVTIAFQPTTTIGDVSPTVSFALLSVTDFDAI
jgi:hypothetical protein